MDFRTYCSAALCSLLFLSACGEKKDETPPPKLFSEQREALDKAKTVNDTLQKSNAEQQKKIEHQSQ
ncbi:MAG: hypothetical protein FD121_99 [Gallionellaceae bacterium]|nr:MAG: hypothetical protein FD121_99 [Gallionellaceae bacterium]